MTIPSDPTSRVYAKLLHEGVEALAPAWVATQTELETDVNTVLGAVLPLHRAAVLAEVAAYLSFEELVGDYDADNLAMDLAAFASALPFPKKIL